MLTDTAELQLDDFPASLSRALVELEFSEQCQEVEFLAGLLAVEQCPETLALRPHVGWMVCEVLSEEEKPRQRLFRQVEPWVRDELRIAMRRFM